MNRREGDVGSRKRSEVRKDARRGEVWRDKKTVRREKEE